MRDETFDDTISLGWYDEMVRNLVRKQIQLHDTITILIGGYLQFLGL
jgi:hypothetical protein